MRVNWKRHICLLLIAELFLLLHYGGGHVNAEQQSLSAQVSVEEERIEDLTNRILAEEIDLERFYTRYRIVAIKEPRFRRSRYFALQQAAAGLFLGSNLINVHEFGGHRTTPENVSVRALRQSVNTGLVGSVFEGGSSGFEFGSNWLLANKNKRLGFAPSEARRAVRLKLQVIDADLKERDKLVTQEKDAQRRALYLTESDVLKYFRDWCLYEFAGVYADAKSYQASNNVYYALDVTASSIYLASYLLSYRALRSAGYSAGASVAGIVGDGFGIISAPSYTFYYYLSYKRQTKLLSKYFKERFYDAEAITRRSVDRLEDLVFSSNVASLTDAGQVITRVAVYKLWANRHHNFIEKQQTELRRLSKVALQSAVAGPLISSAFLQQDIIGTVTSYRLRTKLKATNNLALAAAIPVTAAAGSTLSLSSYWYVDDILHSNYLKRQKERPIDLLQKRLDTLDELEAILGNSPKP